MSKGKHPPFIVIPNQQLPENQGPGVPPEVDTPPLPNIPEDPLANVPINELPFAVCGMCQHRTPMKGICMALPPQIVPQAIIPAPVKLVQPGSIPPMIVKSGPMRIVVKDREPACGIFERITDEQFKEREQRLVDLKAQMELQKNTEEGPGSDSHDQ